MKTSASPISGKAAVALLALVPIAAAIGLAIWVVQLRRELVTAEREAGELRQRSGAQAKLEQENARLRAEIAALDVEIATMTVAAAAAKSNPAPAAPAAAGPAAALAAMANNPAMRAMMATSQKRVLENRFAELFTQLQFSPEQRARFIELLSEGQSAITEAGLKLVAGNLSAAEIAALQQHMKELQEGMEPRIRAFLGDDAKFAVYKQYIEQQTERTQLNAFKATLAQSGQAPLSAAQSSALMDIMYTERKNFRFTPSPPVDPANPAAALSGEAMATRLREQELLNTAIANRAAAVLTPEQLDNLRRDQASRLEAAKAANEIARQMLGRPLAK